MNIHAARTQLPDLVGQTRRSLTVYAFFHSDQSVKNVAPTSGASLKAQQSPLSATKGSTVPHEWADRCTGYALLDRQFMVQCIAFFIPAVR